MKVADLLEGLDRNKIYDLKDPKKKEVASVKDAQELANIIKAQSAQMLAAYKATGKFLYRGVNSADVHGATWSKESPSYIITGIRKNRMPVQMPAQQHEELHKAFLKIGLKATRKNSIFCSTDPDTADAWGTVYIVFVKDGWNGTIFEKVKNDYAFYKLRELAFGPTQHKDSIKAAFEELKRLGPKNISTAGELKTVLSEQYMDVLITGDSYIGLKVGKAETNEVLELLGLRKHKN